MKTRTINIKTTTEIDEDDIEGLKHAAKHEFVCAQWRLGYLYLTGTGVKKDPKKAGIWIRRAAKQQCNNALMAIDAGSLEGKPLPHDCEPYGHGCAHE